MHGQTGGYGAERSDKDVFGKWKIFEEAALLPSDTGFFRERSASSARFLREGMSGREFILCLFPVFLLVSHTGGWWRILEKAVGVIFRLFAERKLGKDDRHFSAFLFHAFWDLTYLLHTFGRIGQTFLLPGEPNGIFTVMALLAGIAMAYRWRSGRERGSAAPLLFFQLLLLILFSAFHQQPEISEAMPVFSGYKGMFGQVLKMFSVFGGLSFTFSARPRTDRKSWQCSCLESFRSPGDAVSSGGSCFW